MGGAVGERAKKANDRRAGKAAFAGTQHTVGWDLNYRSAFAKERNGPTNGDYVTRLEGAGEDEGEVVERHFGASSFSSVILKQCRAASW